MSEAKIAVRFPTLLLLEHGRTDFYGVGDDDRIHGVKFDLPLTEEGREEIERAAEILADYEIASIEHSPMRRTTESAEIVSRATGVKAAPNEKLKPWDSGFASGMRHGAAKDIIAYYVRNPHKTIRDGKPYGDWYEAFAEEFTKKLKEVEKTPGQAHVWAIHSSEVANAPAVIKGDPADVLDERLPGPGKLAAVEKRGGRWRFIKKFA